MTVAHGIGGRSDLPVPLWLALYAGVAAVLVALFVVSALRPRPRSTSPGMPLPIALMTVTDARSTRALLRAVGLVAFGALLATAWFGANDSSRNPAPAWFYVWFWVGLIPVSLIFGPIWRVVNPLRSLAALARRCVPRRMRRDLRSDDAGHAFAVAGMVVFLWLELAFPHSDSPRAVATFATVYAVTHTVGGALFGPRWFARADTFEMYSGLLASLSPLGRSADGRLVLRGPLAGSRDGRASRGHTVLALVVLGGTMFDGISRLSSWTDVIRVIGRPPSAVLASVVLGGVLVLNLLAYRDAIRMTRPYLRPEVSAVDNEFTRSLVPIMVGYSVAHYFSFAFFEGQRGWLLATDPFGMGWDLLGVGEAAVDYRMLTPALIAVVQVGAIVLGHVAAVVSAHDRVLRVVRAGESRAGHYPMLMLMLVYTGLGIALVSTG
ncbi:hypothetical protein ALI144C_22565 [Actinosynnema sp. ALI-1.44]|uniref:hypothetical protein n=1 Tax=Actinosynnema sp. ALI-1.44 TaxID=1933779 RepID=UPI00097C68ED|nr:hypothetical protein [Actinosynnema sp. ALI-1.44]ONI81305.1 hypothetical protein ALI144C_22565 [Actinosynnema sp. ALI-1.44]